VVSNDAYNWYDSFIANIWGHPVYTSPMNGASAYYMLASPTNNVFSNYHIYRFNYYGTGDDGSHVPLDTNSLATALIEGNWDPINNGQVWNTQSAQSVPNSYFLSAKPDYWTNYPSLTWPPNDASTFNSTTWDTGRAITPADYRISQGTPMTFSESGGGGGGTVSGVTISGRPNIRGSINIQIKR
jgi:hypothetical protein